MCIIVYVNLFVFVFVFVFLFVVCFFLCLVNLYIRIIVHLYSRVSIRNYVQLKICHLKIGIGYWCFVFGIWYLVLGIGDLVFGVCMRICDCDSFCICICTCIDFCILGTSPKWLLYLCEVSARAKHFCSPMKVTIALLFLHCYLQVSLLSCHRMSMQRTGLRLYKVSSVQDALCAIHKKCMCKSA